MALGFYVAAKWTSVFSPRIGGGFHSFELSREMLPFLEAGGTAVDLYDGGEFQGEALHELKTNIVRGLAHFREQLPNLNFSDSYLEDYYKKGKRYGLDLLLPRDQAIADLEGVLKMAELAIERDETLFFMGD